jgi:hypothetical protein
MRSMMHAAHTTPDQRPVLTGHAIQAGERSERRKCGRGSRRRHAILHIKIGLPQRLRAARNDAAHERRPSAVSGHDLKRAVSRPAEAAQSTVGLIPTAANLRATASYSFSVMPGLPLTTKSR